MPDDTVRKALEGFGRVNEVTRDVWHVAGFEHVESTTRILEMTLNPGASLERLPHKLQLSGGMALVVVPGSAPLGLRCPRLEHVRKDCIVAKSDDCMHFGHTREECVHTLPWST